ncbi:glucosamine-6-phosphate deaminase, partial [Pirellulales bacterium]|nr:glucosamine-6-phosphate deaminase [Pirellulales bacterium]
MKSSHLPMQDDQIERVPCRIYHDAADASRSVAEQIAALVRDRAAQGRTCVLGLATGSTPTGVYDELIRMHREEGLSLSNVITFNLDEYFPMQPEELQSYVRFMREHLFDHVDIPAESTNVPDGRLDESAVADYCRSYEAQIADAGGVDLQLLGVGRTGHIGFNEPGSSRNSRTRLITLDHVTRRDAASDFFGEENVPRRAITMGVGTILDAGQIILMAWGEGKTRIIRQAVEGEISTSVAASFLQEHPNAQIVLDEAAAEHLTRRREPWTLGPVEWDEVTIRTAVIWLAHKLQKPILKLTAEDYNEAGLQDLLATKGSAYDLNLLVFRALQATITGWPGGKPERRKQPGDRDRRDDHIFPKRVVIFSPHPDDDVISMGGTLIRLVDQGHEVHVAYQTSGNIAVFDDDAVRFAEFASGYNRRFEIDPERTGELEEHVERFVKQKLPGQIDS